MFSITSMFWSCSKRFRCEPIDRWQIELKIDTCQLLITGRAYLGILKTLVSWGKFTNYCINITMLDTWCWTHCPNFFELFKMCVSLHCSGGRLQSQVVGGAQLVRTDWLCALHHPHSPADDVTPEWRHWRPLGCAPHSPHYFYVSSSNAECRQLGQCFEKCLELLFYNYFWDSSNNGGYPDNIKA